MDTFMLEKIYDVFLIPIYVVKKGEKSIAFPSIEHYQSAFEKDKNLLGEIVAVAKKNTKPILYLENYNIYYGAFWDSATCL